MGKELYQTGHRQKGTFNTIMKGLLIDAPENSVIGTTPIKIQGILLRANVGLKTAENRLYIIQGSYFE